MDILRDMEERKVYGGYEVIFPLDEIRVNEPRIEMYKRFQEAAQEHYNQFGNGWGIKKKIAFENRI